MGSLYIPPPQNIDDKQILLSQLSPPWMSTKQAMETPEWVNSRDEIDNFIQQTRMMQPNMSTGPKEHVIPISLEKSPQIFGPTPFYATPQHHINNVISPRIG